MNDLYHPLQSLRQGSWFKLICGASFQHLPAVRDLVLAYTLAGVDCIDVASDPAVVLAAKTGIEVASELLPETHGPIGQSRGMPLLMVSVNDGEDPHFRKAEFDPAVCPADCPRPCEMICPAQAIVFDQSSPSGGFSGVLSDRCYGCGRCLPVCPIRQITTRAHGTSPAAVAALVMQMGVDAIEIHTQVGRLEAFRQLWAEISPSLNHLKLVAISCPDDEGLIEYLWALYNVVSPLPCSLVWQTDGRPMSGDIGTGATRAAIRLGQKVLAAKLPGYVQLAGGTNHHTVPKLRSLNLLNTRTADSPRRYIAGVAYGSYARTLLQPVLNQLEARSKRLEMAPDLLEQAVELATSLVSQLKPGLVLPEPLTEFPPAITPMKI
mgnify:CR=1 FL=1